MTKEPITIDDVDVKDCKRRIGKNNFCRYYKRPCAENNYNCIWKKYLRKEQECEEWKKDYATAKGMYDLCQSDFMELAKIKDNYKQALQDIKSLCLEQNLKADFFACEILQKCEVIKDV